MIFRREKKQTGAVNTDSSRKCEPAVCRTDFSLREASYYWLFIRLLDSLRIVFHRCTCASETCRFPISLEATTRPLCSQNEPLAMSLEIIRLFFIYLFFICAS